MEKLPKRLDRFPQLGALNLPEQGIPIFQPRRCISPFGLQLPCFAPSAFEARLQRRRLRFKKANRNLDCVKFPVGRLESSRQRWFASAMRGKELAQFDQRRPKLIELRVQFLEMIRFARHEVDS